MPFHIITLLKADFGISSLSSGPWLSDQDFTCLRLETLTCARTHTHRHRQTNTICETVKQLNQEFWFDFKHNLCLYVIRLSHIILHMFEFYNPASVLHAPYASYASCAVLVCFTGNATNTTNATGCTPALSCLSPACRSRGDLALQLLSESQHRAFCRLSRSGP